MIVGLACGIDQQRVRRADIHHGMPNAGRNGDELRPFPARAKDVGTPARGPGGSRRWKTCLATVPGCQSSRKISVNEPFSISTLASSRTSTPWISAASGSRPWASIVGVSRMPPKDSICAHTRILSRGGRPRYTYSSSSQAPRPRRLTKPSKACGLPPQSR